MTTRTAGVIAHRVLSVSPGSSFAKAAEFFSAESKAVMKAAMASAAYAVQSQNLQLFMLIVE